MLIVSYDIKNDKVRNKFSKLLQKQGAIRLQFSVYEVINTQRVFDNLSILIEDFATRYLTGADSVVVFDVNSVKLKKYGNAIHRDKDIVFL